MKHSPSRRMNPCGWWMIVGAFGFFLAGCGEGYQGDDSGQPGDDAGDAQGDPGQELPGDAPADPGGDGDVGADATEQCTQHDQPCFGSQWSNTGYLCEVGLQRCLERCQPRSTLTCPAGSYCFELVEPEPGLAGGVCLTGDCNDACFTLQVDCADSDLYTCDCEDSCGLYSCESRYGTCHALGNEASFCLSAGAGEPGDPCRIHPECAPGLFCLNLHCVRPCDLGATAAGHCLVEQECVPVFAATGANRPGACGLECPLFSQGECPEGQRCEGQRAFLSGDLTAAMCLDYQQDAQGGLIPIVEPWADCDGDPSDGLSSQCPEGHLCQVHFIGDAVGRCVQLCDPGGEGNGPFSDCPSEVGAVPSQVGDPGPLVCPVVTEGLGWCMPSCEPYLPGVPYQDTEGNSTGRWMGNGCPHDLVHDLAYACFPFVTGNDEATPLELDGPPELQGFCVARHAAQATEAFSESCPAPDGAECNPDAFCAAAQAPQAGCTKLCRPYSGTGGSDCDREAGLYCQNLVNQAYGLCTLPLLEMADLHEGDACPQELVGSICADDDTVCLELPVAGGGTESVCSRLCKKGLGEADGRNNPTCPPLDGTDRICRNEIGFGTDAPGWLSVCGDAP